VFGDKEKVKRIQVIDYKGKEIIYLDFSDCNVGEIFQVIEMAEKIIRIQPLNSVLTLTNVSGTKYNREVIQAMKEFVNDNKPFVKAGAVVGIDGLKRVVYDAITRFSGRNLPAFDDNEKAKDWLVEQ
jgi:hypothetical protein